ncbi:MAG: acetate kinase [Candidatus Nealsonbacteria bacterium CG08_land_8_20_14_0_20_38_20]|uniref:Acetate kinase n=1 Tax=Candidatus Nealsonbacteria bacterium CG08_land_8_20_14_0_20_38_20 TaxID=1974705 RepID=A0A2H0YL40_9BACT|nr:MAG: acetate kinase [Candidatus Nealsonbacteria bacterium CG08_land_8_20_14_0_20_38_20]
MNKKIILVLNSGSSSVKYSLFNENLKEIEKGIEERIGLEGGAKNHREAIKRIFKKITDSGKIKDLSEIKTIGHRVVHGGEDFRKPVLVNEKVIKKLKEYSKLAPLHNPPNILGIEACRELLPKAKNVAVFDTSFYNSLTPEAYLYAIPYQFYQKEKIRRYGFHGISHNYVSQEAKKILGKKIQRLITCHLGAGSSITATFKGKPIDTSMGFTPLEGLVMESRSGSIDPAIPIYLISQLGFKPEEVDNLLNKKSGFIGICGIKDFRDILKSKDEKAKLAYRIYLRSVIKHIGAYTGLLGGLDALVFTAGIGEGAVRFRKDAVDQLKYLGAEIDQKKNKENKYIISTKKSRVDILVVPTNEALMIAKETFKLIKH